MKTIHRTVLSKFFTILPNKLLRDSSLSFRARGVLAMILTNSEEWEVTNAWLQNHGPEGREAIASAMRELEVAGYAVFHHERDQSGSFSNAVWTFYDDPVAVEKRSKRMVKKDCRDTGSPINGKPVHGEAATKKDHLAEGPSEEEASEDKEAPSAFVVYDERFALPIAEPTILKANSPQGEALPPEPPIPATPLPPQVVIPVALNTPAFVERWSRWMAHRRKMKKPVSWEVMFNEQLQLLLPLGPDQAIACIASTMANGYTGLFPDKFKSWNGGAKPASQPSSSTADHSNF